MADGIAVACLQRADLRPRPRPTSTTSSWSTRRRSARPCCCWSSGPRPSSNRPGPPRWPPSWPAGSAGTGPAVAVLSGGNVDPLLLTKLIEHGLSAAGRYLTLRIVMADRVGALAALTSELARLGAQRPRRGAPPQRPGPGPGRGGGAGHRGNPRPRPPRRGGGGPHRRWLPGRAGQLISLHRCGRRWPGPLRVGDLPQAQAVGRSRLAGRGPGPGSHDGGHFPGLAPARARPRPGCRRWSAPSAGRTTTPRSRSAASRPPGRPSGRRAPPAPARPPATGGRRQNDEKSCSPYSGSQASRMAARSSGRSTCQAVPAVNGSATGWLRTV